MNKREIIISRLMAYLSDFTVWLNATTRQSIFGIREKITLRSLLNNMSEQTLTDLYLRFADRIWYYDHIDANPFCIVSSVKLPIEKVINPDEWHQEPEVIDGETHYDQPSFCVTWCPFGNMHGFCGMKDSVMFQVEEGVFLKEKYTEEFEKFELEKERFPELN